MGLFASLFTLLTVYYTIVLPLIGLILLGLVIYFRWNNVKYFLVRLRIGFPLIGFIARNAKQAQETASNLTGGVSWYNTERELCTRYHRYYDDAKKDPDHFDRCTDYLKKVEESGRKLPGAFWWTISAGLVVAEAFMFALVFTPFMATNISADNAEWMALAAAFLLGTLLIALTHAMGKQIHENSLIKKASVLYQAKNDNVEIVRLPLEETRLDDDAPRYRKILNRLEHGADMAPGWKLSAGTLVFILALAVLAYMIRSSTINEMETEMVNASPYAGLSAQAGDGSPFSTPLTIGPFTLPEEAEQDNQRADQRAASETIAQRIFGYKLTFILLSVIFIGVQGIGIHLGMTRSFVGVHSREAHEYMAGFSSRSEFVNWYERKRESIARDAEAHLSSLQKKIARKNRFNQSGAGVQRRSFALYVHEQEQEKLRHTTPLAQTVPVSAPDTPVPVPSSVTADTLRSDAATPSPAPVATPTGSADDDRIKALGDLTGFSDAVLTGIAEGMKLDPAILFDRREVQNVLKRVQQGA